MHEVAAIKGAIHAALEAMQEAGASRIISLQLTLGVSGHLTEEAARHYFEVLAASTPASGAALSFSWVPATYQCFECLHRFESLQPPDEVLCPRCSGTALEVSHHESCAPSVIEVAFDQVPEGYES